MNSYGKGMLQLIQLAVFIFRNSAVVKFDHNSFFEIIYLCHSSHVAVKNTYPLIQDEIFSLVGVDCPFQLVIVPDLHDLIAFPDKLIAICMLFFGRIRRIKVFLQDLIQHNSPKRPFFHRRKDLDIKRSSVHISRKFIPYKLNHVLIYHICITSFQEKEVSALIVQNRLLSVVNSMSVHDYITLFRLSEYFFEVNSRKLSALNKISENLSRANTWKL